MFKNYLLIIARNFRQVAVYHSDESVHNPTH